MGRNPRHQPSTNSCTHEVRAEIYGLRVTPVHLYCNSAHVLASALAAQPLVMLLFEMNNLHIYLGVL